MQRSIDKIHIQITKIWISNHWSQFRRWVELVDVDLTAQQNLASEKTKFERRG